MTRLRLPVTSTKKKTIIALCACAVLIAASIGSYGYLTKPSDPFGVGEIRLRNIVASKAEHLSDQFSTHAYTWPLESDAEVPPIEVASLPHDLGKQIVAKKKSIFFRTILPLVLAENQRIMTQKEWVEGVFSQGLIEKDAPELKTLMHIAKSYRVKGDANDERFRRELLKKIDTIPVELVLAQAAIESGWGTSRFARQGNSLFGEWSYRGTSGLKPLNRDSGLTHTVRAFPDLRASVRSYMHNLNVSRAYREFRAMRADMRSAGLTLDANILASGLKRYSARGEAYVREIRSMIKTNGLDRLGKMRLASLS